MNAITGVRSASSRPMLGIIAERISPRLPSTPGFWQEAVVSRTGNRSGRWTDRAPTLPTGYFPAPEIRGPGGQPAIRASYCCRDHSAVHYKSAFVYERACKVGVLGTGYRKDALRDSFLFGPSRSVGMTIQQARLSRDLATLMFHDLQWFRYNLYENVCSIRV